MPVFDSTTIMFLVQPNAKPPNDPATGEPLANVSQRIERLIRDIESKSQTIVIPTPALAEVLVIAKGQIDEWISMLQQSRHFQIVDFDIDAVKKLVHVTQKIHDNRMFESQSPFTKAQLKYDRQILAVALAENESTIYSDDQGIKQMERYFDIEVIQTHMLPYE